MEETSFTGADLVAQYVNATGCGETDALEAVAMACSAPAARPENFPRIVELLADDTATSMPAVIHGLAMLYKFQLSDIGNEIILGVCLTMMQRHGISQDLADKLARELPRLVRAPGHGH